MIVYPQPLFPDSQNALKYHSTSTRDTCMLNKALVSFLLEDLTSATKHPSFSICINSSNDTGLNPKKLIIYNVRSGKVVHCFLDICKATSAMEEAIRLLSKHFSTACETTIE